MSEKSAVLRLIGATVIWSFSFSLIGHYISGHVDPYIAIAIRFLIGALLFLPFFNFRLLKEKFCLLLLGIGAVELGLMYIAYFNAFHYLSVTEVALFTIFTPFYVTLGYDLINRRFSFVFFLTASLAVIGAGIIRYNHLTDSFHIGFLLVQAANIAFATGQILYKHLRTHHPLFADNRIKDRDVFFLFFVGALIPTLPLSFFLSNFNQWPQTSTQYAVLIWLGVFASGLGYLLWNSGAARVNSGTLAIMNNAVIPLAIAINVIFWQATVDIVRFGLGSITIIIALMANYKYRTHAKRCL